ncbi:MAG: helix-turn-helix domain-containing protein [Litorivicinus sp.]
MKKVERSVLFRERLRQAMRAGEVTQTQLAKRIGIDRSTLSSLMTSDQPRTPNAHWVAEAAQVLGVTSDWLLGLEQSAQPASKILGESLQVRLAGREPYHPQLDEWRREAEGKKIRYVPQTLPDFFKTDAVIAFEYAATPIDKVKHQQASDQNLSYLQSVDSDMEVCVARQNLEDFARGQGAWAGLDIDVRRAQWAVLGEVYDQLYPRVRVQLYDERFFYSAPVTVYGAQRAVLFLGETYFSFSTREHIDALSQQVDRLVRNAQVHSHQFNEWLSRNEPSD